MSASGTTPGGLAWASAGRPHPTQRVSGDLHLVAPHPDGVLLAVVDGLGHGEEAEKAARAACEALARTPERPVEELIQRCHEALRRLRGAVVSLASFSVSRATMRWIGVGNVEAILLDPRPGTREVQRHRLLLRGGIVGQNLPSLYAVSLPVAPGALLAMATDGVRSSFVDALSMEGSLEVIAQRTLDQFGTRTDDALVLVARYRGGEA